jgi:hypothetical protein
MEDHRELEQALLKGATTEQRNDFAAMLRQQVDDELREIRAGDDVDGDDGGSDR